MEFIAKCLLKTTAGLASVLFWLIVLAVLTGCATKFGMDNTASGGGSWGIQTWRCDPSVEPVGGNTGEVGNATDRGGTAGTTHP